jgi:transposase
MEKNGHQSRVKYHDGGVRVEGIPQGRYTKECREEAVKRVTDGNMTIPAAARRVSLPPSTLGNWLRASKSGKRAEIGKSQKPLTEIEMELARTKRKLVEVKMERDIVKKAAAYFAKESLPGTR